MFDVCSGGAWWNVCSPFIRYLTGWNIGKGRLGGVVVMLRALSPRGHEFYPSSIPGNLENLSVSIYWPYAFVTVRLQLQCFDALLIFKRMLMSENWLKQDVRILHFMHQICGTFCVRRYQQFCTLMVNWNAYNQNLLIAVTHWVEKTDLIWSAVWSYSTVHAEKVRLALATPLWKQLSHFIAQTPRGPRGCFNCLS